MGDSWKQSDRPVRLGGNRLRASVHEHYALLYRIHHPILVNSFLWPACIPVIKTLSIGGQLEVGHYRALSRRLVGEFNGWISSRTPMFGQRSKQVFPYLSNCGRVGPYRLSRSFALRDVRTMGDVKNVNLDKPRWDQSTYLGRAKHFFTVTNPLNLLYTSAQLDHAKDIVERHRNGKPQEKPLTVEELWKAKHVYDSAFHPVTGEKVFILGRMSAQVPSNMIVTGNMMLFYQTTPAVVFWQWVNQSFNALVNYCNRSDSSMPISQIATSYAIATTGAVATAVALNKMTAKMPSLVGRLVPFAAVAAANCVNIPAMRNKELAEGISVFDDNGKVYGRSKVAAREATISVVISRIIMAAPSMAITPIVMNSLDKKGVLRRNPYIAPTVGIGLTGFILTFATPLACALFAQTAPINVGRVESDIQDAVKKQAPGITTLYYNKGL